MAWCSAGMSGATEARAEGWSDCLGGKARMDHKKLAELSEAMMPPQYRWCNRVYEIGKLLHPELKKDQTEMVRLKVEHREGTTS